MMRRLLALVIATVIAVALSACGTSKAGNSESAATRLQQARAFIDDAPALNFTLSTPSIPSGVLEGVLSATGVGTHQTGTNGQDNGFQGSIRVSAAGITAPVQIIAVDGKVWAQTALLGLAKPTVIDPAQFQAPNPAALMSKTNGMSSLLTVATGLDAGKQTRDGKTIVTTYSGSVAGSVIGAMIPIANSQSPFTVTFSLTDDNHLQKATITGPFFPNGGDITYTLTLTTCTGCAPVVAPAS